MNNPALTIYGVNQNGGDVTELINADTDERRWHGRTIVMKANCYNT
jgi:hypothetical protein